MKKYPDEFKSSVIARMLPPNNESVPELAQETGVPRNTLHYWRIRHMDQKNSHFGKNGNWLSSEDKFAIVLETASMNEHELSAYCRKKGLYPEQVHTWKRQCQKANEPGAGKTERKELKEQGKRVKNLEKELKQKEKALAETAALLTLKKKVQQIWGDPEDEK